MGHPVVLKQQMSLGRFYNSVHVQGVNKVRRHPTIAYSSKSNIHMMFKFCKLKEVFNIKISIQVKTSTVIYNPRKNDIL